MHDTQYVVKTVSELLKKYFLPVHIEVLCRGYKKQVGSELPFEAFGYSSAAEFLQNGCGSAFEVTQSDTDKSVFYVAPQNCQPNGTGLTLKREPASKVSSDSERVRKALQMLGQLNVPSGNKKKMVPPQFKQYLRFLIGRHPNGITAENLVTEFLRVSGSSLSYEMYGYSDHVEMFKDLTDVFAIHESQGKCILYPFPDLGKPLQDTAIRCKTPPAKLLAVRQLPAKQLPAKQLPARKESMSSVTADGLRTNAASPVSVKHVQPTERQRCHDVAKIDLDSGGSLVYVKFNGNYYVPTACVAALAGLQSDTILAVLDAQHIDVQGVEILRESVQDHAKLRYEIALVNCPLVITKAGALVKEIPMVPLRSVAVLLKVFGLKNFELDECLRKIRSSFVKV